MIYRASLAQAKPVVRKAFGKVGRLAQVADAPGYFVSDHGFVYTVLAYTTGLKWRAVRLKTMRHSGGYPQVNIKYAAGYKITKIHSLVAAAFLPLPRPGQYLLRHDDDDPENNHY